MQVQKNRKSIVLTGGHAATTAISVVEEIKRQKKEWRIHFIGTKRAMEGQATLSFESEVLPKAGVKFHSIVAGRLQRRFSLWTIPSLLKVPVGFFQALILLTKIKPALILSFGGFASFPVVTAGWILGIPVVIHEQTSAAGLANRLCAPFARKIAISRRESIKYFPESKVNLTGNPISQKIVDVVPKKKMGDPPTIYITGGSRGSQVLNNLVLEVLEKLLTEFNIIHQTGELDIEKIKRAKDNLPKNLALRYEFFANKSQDEVVSLYRRADTVVSRAGANTVSEIGQVARPAVLIPIPWSYEEEQQKNAKVLEKAGGAYILNQEGATGENLYALIKKVMRNWEKMVTSLENVSQKDRNAAKALVGLMEETF